MKKSKTPKKSKTRNYVLIGIVLIIVIAIFSYAIYRPSNEIEISDFTLTDLNGQTYKFSDFKGKVVIIDFMATWCQPCLIETGNLIEIWDAYGDEVIIISIDVDLSETEDQLRDFKEGFPQATWIWAMDNENLAYDHKITTVPTLFLLDQDGKIVSKHEGITDNQTLIDEIENLLAK
jgi:thiol-disulfide isomerase/thioredoxin